jgi:hypothetical protein
MKKTAGILFIASVLLSLFVQKGSSQLVNSVTDRYWKPQADDVWLQESGERIETAKPITGVGLDGNRCLVVAGAKVNIVDGALLKADISSPDSVFRLVSAGGSLWALAADGVYKYVKNAWVRTDSKRFVDLCVHRGAVYGATKDEIFRFENGKFISAKPEGGYNSSDVTLIMEDGSQVHAEPVKLGPIQRIESHNGTLYILEPGKLILYDGLMVNRDFVDWGTLPSRHTSDMISAGSRLYIATAKGLAVLRGATLSVIKGTDGLPVENTTCMVRGFDDDMWIGTVNGAVRMLKNGWQYFGAEQWLPDGHVNDIASGDRTVYIATDKGLSIIHYEPYTLLKKSAYFEKQLDELGHKRLGFVHILYRKGDKWIRKITDNDGGNTATYLAAMCYKYAATKDETARLSAVDSFNALMWLERITGVDGFFARAVWSPADDDEMDTEGSGGLPARWYLSKDGKWHWKGDTSSDEVTSHFYAVSLFYDLVAQGKEKEMAGKHLERIASYIQENGWVLKDLDGQPTRWGHWNPEYLLRPYGFTDRGLNGLEAMNFMEAAFHATGDVKFRKGLEQLRSWGYDENTVRLKNVFPPETIAPWDNELAFESYNTILRYVTDEGLHSILLRSLERTWEVLRIDHNPWFNFTYGAFTGNDCELDQSIKYLRDYKLDCIQYSYYNSDRDDLYPEPGYVSYEGARRSFSPREADSPILTDGGNKGRSLKEPTDFLKAYWMGRYYGMILPPAVTDPSLLTIRSSELKNKGAKPYSGPQRPVLY